MYPRNCTMCEFVFHTEAAWYHHYVQEPCKDTRCMSQEEMQAFGYNFKEGAYETWGDRHRDSWDPDRFIWSVYYKPALMFGDMYPKEEFLEAPRWRRLLIEAFYGKISGMVAAWKGNNVK